MSPRGLDRLVDQFETQDMGELWDRMPEVELDVDIRRRTHLVAVDEDLVGRVSEIAQSRSVSSESLINSLLREKLAEAS